MELKTEKDKIKIGTYKHFKKCNPKTKLTRKQFKQLNKIFD